ncbi:MAG: beta-L-arabinofuranosidase domain-containing protein, partial [Planctomycetota bacterium]
MQATRYGKRSFGRTAVVGLMLGALLAVTGAQAADRLTSVDLRAVKKVGGEIGRRIDVTVGNNLLVLDADGEFLAPARKRTQKSGYVGLGKLIDTLVRFAAHTGDQRVLDRKKHVVAETIETQEPDGYIGLFTPEARMWELWDVHEMSYIVQGLASDHKYFGDEKSLAAARKLAGYIIKRWEAEPKRGVGEETINTHMSVTGLERALLLLDEQTGDRRYVDFCIKQRRLPEWDLPIVRGRWGKIEGHAYAYFAHCSAQLGLNRLQPAEKLLAQSDRTIDFLTAGDGLTITGATGYHECWHDSQDGQIHLGETCATAYMLRLLDDLIRLEGDSRYGDMAERAIYNSLFAAQSPDGRKIRYYTPFDGPRVYYPKDGYCCPNNYRRIVADLPGMIYYTTGDGLAVNLYTPSTAELKLPGGQALTVRQETDYPNSGKVTLRVDPAVTAESSLSLRIPAWCKGAKVSLNGKPCTEPIPAGAFFKLRHEWRPGDQVELEMPMPWRFVKGRKAQAGLVAVMRGPMLFCLNPERNDNKKLADMNLRTITLK